MYKYITVPKEISIAEITSKKTCLAPSKYHNFHLNKNTEFKALSTLIFINVGRQKLARSKVYDYVEIGDIDVNTGHVKPNTFFGYNSPSENPLKIELDDILVSTVRTYRKGIGMITSTNSNILTSSPALFVIRRVSPEISKEYLLAILRSDFFMEQILSLQNRGMYPRLDKESASNVQIPIPNDKKIIEYISVLSRSLINKYQVVEEKNGEILDLVRNEIVNNQNNQEFSYSFPSQSELEKEGRIDAGYFSEAHKRLIFETQNYSNGYFTLDKAGLTLIPGPSLELKLLGTRIDSKRYERGFYRLITPKQFSNYGTISYYEYIGTPKTINPIQYW